MDKPEMLVSPRMAKALADSAKGLFRLSPEAQAHWDSQLVTLANGSRVTKTALAMVLKYATPEGERPS